MIKTLIFSCALSLGLFAVGCSDPTLEEACADYCAAVESASCDSPTADECSKQCDQLREQLDGKCIDEYTELFDCGADLDYECRDGFATSTDQACLGEALTVLDCTGVLSEGDSSSSSP